ncbi:MAG: PD-(D/E)XK nuclease family protein [Methylotenera sp.]|nr:PD-(D/E)XK nuclease family protein [Oligoflexia bacterium]
MRSLPFTEILSARKFNGLHSKTWICVGQGFAREDIKEYLLSRGQGFTREVVTTLQGLCVQILSPEIPDLKTRSLNPLARQEVLRMLLAEPKINAKLPELKRLRRQNGFYKKLDRSIQGGRMSFAHAEEQAVYRERLNRRGNADSEGDERRGNSGDFGISRPVRDEIEALAFAYETWLSASSLFDPPLLLRRASEHLEQLYELPFRAPEEILYFTAVGAESLEDNFWSSLKRFTTITRIGPLEDVASDGASELAVEMKWEKWHTLDDAADALAEKLSLLQLQGEAVKDHAILLADIPQVRRTLKRALKSYGLVLADPRDPTRLRWEESVKWATQSLELVARNFERSKVVSFLRTDYSVKGDPQEVPGLIREINERGIRQGLEDYRGGKLALVHLKLSELAGQFSGRKSCLELAQAHLHYLSREISQQTAENAKNLHWLLSFFEQIWKQFNQDVALIGNGDLKAPLLFWLERLTARLDEASPPVERSKNHEGVQIFRLGQAPLQETRHLWFFGLSARWLGGDGSGDYWYSEREREILSGEFSIRSSIQVRKERIAQLKSWLNHSQEIMLLDAEYDWDGRERETLLPVLKELGLSGETVIPVSCGAHLNWNRSHQALRPLPPLQFQLPSLQSLGRKDIRATELDRYSRCEFQGLAGGRWKLWDAREPDSELWPDIRGNVLHAAIKVLIEARDSDGNFAITPAEALETAWSEKRPAGLLRGDRLERYTRARLLTTLQTFCEKERDYVKRAQTQVHSLEGPQLRLEFDHFNIIGIPDRIDLHPEGIFVLDYKTSSALPSGADMLDLGYRMQLPFYALAAQKQLGRPAVGVQFVELTRKGGRGHGIFFKHLNGKNPGQLTNTRSKLNVTEADASEVWAQCEKQLVSQAERYAAGYFSVKPKKATECRSCFFRDLCGERRLSGAEGDADAAGEGAGS